ncbi:MAG TPA: tetratricopeptide repeat protein [Dongiaceae bacterium]|jgi:tetratricopeptide (TPR) repeat protein
MKRIEIISGLTGIIACLSILPGIATASGGGSNDEATQPDPYKQAQQLIDDDKYTQAIPILKKLINDHGAYADALNLLGYSYRKSGDANTALTYYNQALQMEPKHLGANEYLGELYLELKQPDKANERLAVLKAACGDCDEYEDLSRAITKYKSASN